MDMKEVNKKLGVVNYQLADCVRHVAVRLPIHVKRVKPVHMWTFEEKQRMEGALNTLLNYFEDQIPQRDELLKIIEQETGEKQHYCSTSDMSLHPSS